MKYTKEQRDNFTPREMAVWASAYSVVYVTQQRGAEQAIIAADHTVAAMRNVEEMYNV